ncbi:MAG: hypothetical protein QFC55_06870, partial [Chloroflexota bacterium]|nr:hypothetical protein [Chloroflexota bacterium]
MLGGSAKGSTADRALGRAGKALDESAATRTAIEGVPEDLAGLDAKGLKQAAIDERMTLKAQAETEKASLEELRKPQREELANQIRDMHDDLANGGSRPIYSEISTADLGRVAPELKGIEGVQTAQVALADSFKTLRRTLRNSVAAGEDPYTLLRPLQARQGALETLQAKMPEILEARGGNAGALEHVDGALSETREQISRIQALSKSNPVSGARLTELQSGISPRLAAIEAAQEALATAPQAGMLQRGLQHAAFTGATALAHAIPGVGIMAPYAGKFASDAIGKVFEHLGAAKAAASARMGAARDAFLSLGSRNAPAAAVTATRVLSQVRFGPSSEPTGKQDLASLYKARSAELRNQTMYDPNGQVVI